MTDIEKLSTLCRVLLSALEENQEFLEMWCGIINHEDEAELRADNEAVINDAKEVLLEFHA